MKPWHLAINCAVGVLMWWGIIIAWKAIIL